MPDQTSEPLRVPTPSERITELETLAERRLIRMQAAELDVVEAREAAAWFAAEAAHWKTEADLYHTVAAQNYENDGVSLAALDAERTELQARVAELEAAAERDHARIAGLELALQDRDSIYQHAGELEIRLNAANNEIVKLRGAPSITEPEAAHVKEPAGERHRIDVTHVAPGELERMARSGARPSPELRAAIDRARDRKGADRG